MICFCLFSSFVLLSIPTTGIRAKFLMVDEKKIKTERFNRANFGFWKIQTEDYMYQKDLYYFLGGKAQKPKEMSDGKWVILNLKALGQSDYP